MTDKRLTTDEADRVTRGLVNWDEATATEQAAWLLGYLQALEDVRRICKDSTAPSMVALVNVLVPREQDLWTRLVAMGPESEARTPEPAAGAAELEVSVGLIEEKS